jgi:hypothetical protein
MNLDDYWANAIWSLAPTIGIGAMFWLVIRAVIRADRSERKAYDRIEQELRAELEIERRAASTGATESEHHDG